MLNMAGYSAKRFVDMRRVNINEPQHMQHWCEVFGCSPEKLRMAVYRFGISVDAIRKYLKRK
jgi:hypothetical protein